MTNQNFKIVCIVNNPVNVGQGLVHTFKHDDRSVLNEFISSNLYYFNMYGEMETKFGYDNNLKFLLISEDRRVTSKNMIEENDEWEILFVCDSIPLDENYPYFIFDENTLVMFHRTPNISNQDTIFEINGRKVKKGKKGQHEPYENQGYQRLLKLTEAWENGSFDKEKYAKAKQNIIDWFGVNDELEAKLELLHNCLLPKSIPEKLDSLISSYNKAFSDFKKAIEGKSHFEKEYIEALTTFRDAILGS